MMKLNLQNISKLFRDSDGASLVEFALFFPIFLLLIGGAVDYGRAYTSVIDLSAAAQAGALYGAQNPTDIDGMVSASQSGARGVPGFSVTATYGCECPDGSAAVASCTAPPSCPDNYVNYVDVTTTAPYTPIMKLPGLIGTGTFKGEARMRSGGD
jgi:uncharacterized membrane protein